MKKRIFTILQYSFFLGLGLFLAWLSVKDLTAENKALIKSSLKTAKYWLLIPVLTILILCHYIRALRWRLLIQSLGYNPSRTNAFFAVLIGYLTNNAVPRLGEVVKCTMLARYEKIPADKLIGTIILERIIDLICLLIVFGTTLVIQPDLYSKLMRAIFNPKRGTSDNAHSSLFFVLILISVIIIILAIWMVIKKKKPKDIVVIFKKIGLRIWEGISAVKHLKKRKQFIILTFLLWACYLYAGYIGFLAFKETNQYGIKEAFTILTAGSIGMVATPGGIGAYALLLQQTMIVYGLNPGVAIAFGWILWLVQTIIIATGGLISFVAMPWYNKQKNREKP
jgi:uncharacterized protein (TIRG00374 family)